MPDAPAPENTPQAPPSTAESETQPQDQEFTPEWKQSVEDRFAQIGDALKSFSSRRGTGGHPATARSTQPTQPSGAPSAGAAGAGASGGQAPAAGAGAGAPDARPPKPTHWWYRKFGE